MRTHTAIIVAALAALASVGCSLDPLTNPDRPVITEESAGSAAGAQALRGAAISAMTNFTGAQASLVVGVFTDELINTLSGTGLAWDRLDQRNSNPLGFPLSTMWSSLGGVLYTVPVAQRALRKYVPDSPTRSVQLGQLHGYHGLALTVAGEIYCNGIPFSYLSDDGTPSYDPKSYTNAEVWVRALVQFDSALSAFPAGDAGRSLARVGKARVLLDLNRPSEAAAVVGAGGDGAGSLAVPTSFTANVEYAASGTTTGSNPVFERTNQRFQFGVPNGAETPVSIDWRDARIAPQLHRKGVDGTTDIYLPSGVAWTRTSASAYPMANGIEARLIEAEVLLRAGDPAWRTVLNQLRAAPVAPWASTLAAQLPALADPGTQVARENLLFRERAMWLFLTGHRLGDLRRLVKHYGRSPESVFPSGPYFKGGSYGVEVNVTPSQSEADTNPHWRGCIDRNP